MPPKIRNNYSALSNYSFSNIAIAIFALLLLLHLCVIFGISSLLLFLINLSKVIAFSNYDDSHSFRSFSLLEAIAKIYSLLFAIAFKSVKERQKRSHEPIYKTDTKKEEKSEERKLLQS